MVNSKRSSAGHAHSAKSKASSKPKTAVVKGDDSSGSPTVSRTHPPVIAIGCSAGGLDALKQLMEGFAASIDAVFIVAQHQNPDFQSHLHEILAKHTPLPVELAQDGSVLQPSRVYVLPPGQAPTITDGRLTLSPSLGRLERTAIIDELFTTVAIESQDRGVGIILSGSGADGARGIRAIKSSGGLALVQTPSTASFPEMPERAQATGIADSVLAVEEIPAKVSGFLKSSDLTAGTTLNAEQAGEALESILQIIRRELGFDLRGYKKNTLLRRIARRAALSQMRSASEYIELLRTKPTEVRDLFRDLMINVTNFFRDPEAFDILAKEAIPAIVHAKAPGEAIRAWVPACASGEEAYSIAILILDHLERVGKNHPIQIFATDIDQEALQIARAGKFPESIASELSAEHLQRYFNRTSLGYEVKKELRECIIFAMQNLIGDPPFSRLDLVSCRNLFIYLEPALQKRALGLFHFGLNEQGFLLIGNAETVGDSLDQFEPISKKWRLYRRIGPSRPRQSSKLFQTASSDTNEKQSTNTISTRTRNSFAQLLDQELLRIFTPAAVLINRSCDVLYLHGDIGAYLKLKSGDPSTNLLDLIPTTLRGKLRSSLENPGQVGGRSVFEATLEAPRPGALFHLSVRAVPTRPGSEELFIVTFEDTTTDNIKPFPAMERSGQELETVEQLENLLRSTRDDLNHTIEDLEGANEELRASNEEVVSMNEELQSANEELETSKEELQSVNEELSTVNAQLNSKVLELENLSNDLSNLLSSTEIATVFLDTDLHIKRFTPSARRLMNLIAADVGRSISDITKKYDDGNLSHDAELVLRSLSPIEREVHSKDGYWYLQRILPYRTNHNKIEGVVVTFSDITALKEAANKILSSELRYRHLADTTPVMMWESGLDMGVTFLNKPWLDFTGQPPQQSLGNGWVAAVHPDDAQHLIEVYRRSFNSRESYKVECRLRDTNGAYRWFIFNGVPRYAPNGVFEGYVGTGVDITERKELESELRSSKERYQQLLETTSVVPWEANPDTLVFTYVGPQAAKIIDIPLDAWTRPNFIQSFLHPDDRDHTIGRLRAAGISGTPTDFEFRIVTGEESVRWIRCIAGPLKGLGDRTQLRGFLIDISARKEAEKNREKLERELLHTQKLEALGILAGGIAHDFNNLLTGMLGYAEIGARETAHDKRLSSRFNGIIEAGNRARELVKQILTFSRRQDFRNIPVNLTKIVEETLPLLRASIPAYIEIRPRLEAPLLFASGDPTRFQQVLMNLATNAYQAIGNRPGRIEITCRTRDITSEDRVEFGGVTAGAYAELVVSDNGSGMDPQTINRIFEPFFTTKSADKGTGMGLSVAHGIISGLNGKILVKSELGSGSSFTVLLPRLSEGRVLAQTEAHQDLVRGSGNILFVDDEEMIVNLAREMLEAAGYVVSGVTNPSQAYEMFRISPQSFDLVVLDQNMPEMTGSQLAEKLLALRPELPIVLVTGYSQDLSPEKLQQLGIKSILSKPYTLAGLAAEIGKFAGKTEAL